jgi:hypothetical protein
VAARLEKSLFLRTGLTVWSSPDLASVCSVTPMADGSIAIAPSALAKSTLHHASVAEAQVVRAV